MPTGGLSSRTRSPLRQLRGGFDLQDAQSGAPFAAVTGIVGLYIRLFAAGVRPWTCSPRRDSMNRARQYPVPAEPFHVGGTRWPTPIVLAHHSAHLAAESVKAAGGHSVRTRRLASAPVRQAWTMARRPLAYGTRHMHIGVRHGRCRRREGDSVIDRSHTQTSILPSRPRQPCYGTSRPRRAEKRPDLVHRKATVNGDGDEWQRSR